mmetsp:Transcript_21650/g.30101  ORF Transcript_21650/g.30101 Transcript_21650/m.30101 type:complete len:112 (-) Transcript_21650:349-684(-)
MKGFSVSVYQMKKITYCNEFLQNIRFLYFLSFSTLFWSKSFTTTRRTTYQTKTLAFITLISLENISFGFVRKFSTTFALGAVNELLRLALPALASTEETESTTSLLLPLRL